MKIRSIFKLMIFISAPLLCLATGAFAGSSTQVVTINYGVVTSVGVVQKDAKHAGGAVAGGVLGALIGPRRHRGLRVVAGAAAGAAVQGAATSGVLQQYTIALVGGGSSIVSTEQNDIRPGDCVSVEQGQYANIRRVGSIHCDGSGSGSAPDHHVANASSCDAAKSQMVEADTDDELAAAMTKVRTICEF